MQSFTANICSFRANYVLLGGLPLANLPALIGTMPKSCEACTTLGDMVEQEGLTKVGMNYR